MKTLPQVGLALCPARHIPRGRGPEDEHTEWVCFPLQPSACLPRTVVKQVSRHKCLGEKVSHLTQAVSNGLSKPLGNKRGREKRAQQTGNCMEAVRPQPRSRGRRWKAVRGWLLPISLLITLFSVWLNLTLNVGTRPFFHVSLNYWKDPCLFFF